MVLIIPTVWLEYYDVHTHHELSMYAYHFNAHTQLTYNVHAHAQSYLRGDTYDKGHGGVII